MLIKLKMKLIFKYMLNIIKYENVCKISLLVWNLNFMNHIYINFSRILVLLKKYAKQ